MTNATTDYNIFDYLIMSQQRETVRCIMNAIPGMRSTQYLKIHYITLYEYALPNLSKKKGIMCF